jgi:hypothetical protein
MLGAPRTNGASSVLILAESGPNLCKLISFSADGSNAIAQFKGQVWYGSDDYSAAFLEGGRLDVLARLLVIDLKSLAVVTDRVLDGVHTWALKRPIAEIVAVRSKDYSVYFQGLYDQDGGLRRDGYLEANWITGQVYIPYSSPDFGGFKSETTLIALPTGFGAAAGWNRGIVLYDEKTQVELPMPDDDSGHHGFVNRSVYFVPTIGLMEYYKGVHRQLTDANLTVVAKNAKEFPSSNVTSQIFVRNSNGKPLLIWGGNGKLQNQNAQQHEVTEIIVTDPKSGHELMRKPLGAGFSTAIQPDMAGGRVYLVKPETGEIYFLDLKTQVVSFFSKTDLQYLGGGSFVLVAAN